MKKAGPYNSPADLVDDIYKSIFNLEFEKLPHMFCLEFLALAAEGKAVGSFFVLKIRAAE